MRILEANLMKMKIKYKYYPFKYRSQISYCGPISQAALTPLFSKGQIPEHALILAVNARGTEQF